ncbi:cytochrome P450 [Coprinopsis cinerea AmutBmut pab1-1]|nr:cytochrome P450 [Coprinopsis cinerea AmutBmut pab1-1]
MSWMQVLGIGAACWLLYQWVLFHITKRKLRHIPTVGSDSFITSYISAWKFMVNGHQMIQEGYEKYPGKTFKVPTLVTPNRWLIIVSGTKLVEDFRKATEEQLSFKNVAFELLHTDHLFGTANMRTEPYHIDVVRGPMTRGFPGRFDEIKEEIHESFSDLMPPSDDWTPYAIHSALIPIVCRTSNRLFVGLPLCRNPEYRRIQENLTIHIFAAANFLNVLPAFMRPLVGRLITKFPADNKRLQKHLGPLINERIAMDEANGRKWEGRPNDLISWLLDLVPPELKNLPDMTLRIISINIAAIHTTSITLSNTLFDLAPRQEYIEPLRKEVEEIIEEYGWTKEAMGRMRKLDSFIKESSRVSGLASLSVTRKSMTDYKLSDGTVLPAGFRVAVAAIPTHLDPSVYDDAAEFKGFRFAEKREGGEEFDHLRHQMVSLDPNFLFFGHGRPACPGRFFAVNEVKAMLAYILMNYDFKLPEDSKTPPSPHWFASNRSPNQFAKILFRKRQRA